LRAGIVESVVAIITFAADFTESAVGAYETVSRAVQASESRS